MDLFNVYPVFDIALERGKGCYVFDIKGKRYLDLYGGHAVISVGHNHPVFTQSVTRQLHQLPYYSNSVKLPIQWKLARKLGKASFCNDYQLFLCNSGAEAVENALKLASFSTGRKRILSFEGGFHGRTHGALAVTDNPKIRAGINTADHVVILPFNDEGALKAAFLKYKDEIAGVLIEPIQGLGGIREASTSFLQLIERLCLQNGSLFIADEVQAGFDRTGKFFSHQHANVHPQLIAMAKGMGNGFPIGGVLIHGDIKPWFGMLGTTFGGNPLACAASIAVLEILKDEKLRKNANNTGNYLMQSLREVDGVVEVRGKGLMIGVKFDFPVGPMRKELVYEYRILTGSSKDPNVLRLLPPLTLKKKHVDQFIKSLKTVLDNNTAS